MNHVITLMMTKVVCKYLSVSPFEATCGIFTKATTASDISVTQLQPHFTLSFLESNETCILI